MELNIEFEDLLEYLKRSRGFDFTGYKRSGLMRRFRKRMQVVNIETYTDYVDYLEVHPEEFIQLFNTLLINVTSFFRDRSSWEYLASEILPWIVQRKESINSPLRIWSAGCASGEEPYTLAMLLAEKIGIEEFRERVKIYATDMDEDALNEARQANYTSRALTGLPEGFLERYFEPSDRGYIFRKELRRAVIFGRHNLTEDAPISRIDLLVCRNTLMYFNAEMQAQILNRFHFALNDGGFMFLGKAEMLLTHTNCFTPVDLKRRIFSKVARANGRDRLLNMVPSPNEEGAFNILSILRMRESAFETSPLAQVLVDLNGILALANEQARILFGLSPKDVGRPLQDLELSYRPVELRSSIEQLYIERRPLHLREIEWSTPNAQTVCLDIQLMLLMDTASTVLGTSISFTDVTRAKRLHEDLEHSSQELEMAYEELQSTNEELETTNEELQSTVEELETTNEELQSTNEELETMNEELQSTNEELQTINDEFRRRSEELNQVNAFLESILTSMQGPVIVLNRDLVVQIWNHKAVDVWGMRADEVVGTHFLNLDIGLPVEQLRQVIRACYLEGYLFQEVAVEATNRRGKKILCKVTCTPLLSAEKEINGVTLVMEEIDANSD